MATRVSISLSAAVASLSPGGRGSLSRRISSRESTARAKRCAMALCDGSRSKPWCRHHVERAVAVVVLTRHQQPLLSLDELDRRLEDQGADVPAVPSSPRVPGIACIRWICPRSSRLHSRSACHDRRRRSSNRAAWSRSPSSRRTCRSSRFRSSTCLARASDAAASACAARERAARQPKTATSAQASSTAADTSAAAPGDAPTGSATAKPTRVDATTLATISGPRCLQRGPLVAPLRTDVSGRIPIRLRGDAHPACRGTPSRGQGHTVLPRNGA